MVLFMAIEKQTRYSALIDATLDSTLALKDGVVFNNRYEGDPKAGSVKVPKTGNAVVGDYNTVTGGELSEPSLTYIPILIDKDKYVNEIIDNYDATATSANVIVNRIERAGRGLAEQIDIDGASELVANGTILEDTTAVASNTVYDTFVEARKVMSKAGVPGNGRYALVSPDTYAVCLKADEFINSGALSDEIRSTGAVGAIAGFSIYESNNLGENVEVIFGHPDYATRIKEWSVEPTINPLADGKHIGASAIQGRKIYAHKVTEPKAILVKKSVA